MVYHEVQRFSATTIIIIGSFILLIAAFAAFKSPSQAKIPTILLSLAPLAIIAGLYSFIKLQTEVENGVLSVKMALFGGTSIPLKQVTNVEIVEYRPFRDFGGWGVRFGLGGKIYSTKGERAVKVSTATKGVIFIGSQNPEELASAIGA